MKQLFSLPSEYHGHGGALVAWHPDGSFMASAGNNSLVHIFDRYGEAVHEFRTTSGGRCRGLEWDKNGEVLGCIAEGSSIVFLWDVNSQRLQEIESNNKELTWLGWSRGPGNSMLAAANVKGNLLLYNHHSSKKVPIMGKHSKAIGCGAWSEDGKLALGGKDKQITVSDVDGAGLAQSSLKAEPSQIRYVVRKDKGQLEPTVSAILGNKTVYMYCLNKPHAPVELAFQAHYGDLITHQWFGDNNLMAGFSNGFLVVMATSSEEIGEELYCCQLFESLVDFNIQPGDLKVAAVGADGAVVVVDMSTWKQACTHKLELANTDRPKSVGWAGGGEILSVATEQGALVCLLAQGGAVLSACHGNSVAFMSSLKEVTVMQHGQQDKQQCKITVAIEPSFISLGPAHVVVGMNNYAWFYSLNTAALVCEKEYLATVQQLRLNGSTAAALGNGLLYVHPIDQSTGGRSARFPLSSQDQGDSDPKVSCVSLTPEFAVWGDSSGSVTHLLLEDWTPVNEFRHTCAVSQVWPSPSGMRLVLLDQARDAWLYNPLNDQMLPISSWPGTVSTVMWDSQDSHVFAAMSSAGFAVYTYAACTASGPTVRLVGVSALPATGTPMLLQGGVVLSQTGTGAMERAPLSTHTHLKPGASGLDMLDAALALLAFEAAAALCSSLDSEPAWTKFSAACLHHLEIELAIRGYRQLGNAAMVLSLQQLGELEDKNLLAGTVAMISGEFQAAEKLFWSSSQPIRALEMRQDLLQWEEALRLASLLDESQVARISCAYAQQLEHQGDHHKAQQLYDRCLSYQGVSAEQAQVCHKGRVRTTLLAGDSARGVSLAVQMVEQGLADKGLLRECAVLLQSMRQLNDAASLYEKAECYEKAVSIYIQVKNFSSAGRLMEFVSTPKLQLGYAKAKESEGKLADAVVAYRKGKDMDSVVRLLLHEQLDRATEAFQVVRDTQTVSGAKMAAEYCERRSNFTGAIEFLLFAKEADKAFALASTHDAMEVFTKQLGDKGSSEQWLAIANYYEAKAQHGTAGGFFAKCGMHQRAVELYLKSGADAHIQAAIEVVGAARDEQLTGELIDYLVGEKDGIPKEPSHIFKLYMALGSYSQAATTALIIAQQEQGRGNYKLAHKVLFETQQALQQHSIRTPQDLSKALQILHSYILVRVLVRQGDHLSGARMLIRVSKFISKFPAHIVPILTSTVIECQRAGLKRSAYEFASMLMRPEYRAQIAENYKRKIEAIVRKRASVEEAEEPLTPCPHCSAPVAETELDCSSCRQIIPLCIATGRHMVLEEWTCCMHCQFPALYSPFKKLLTAEPNCPMCGNHVDPSTLQFTKDPKEALNALLAGASED